MDQTGVLSKLLRKKFLHRERELGLADEEGFRERNARYHEEGLYYLHRMIDKGLATADFRNVLALSPGDSIFNPTRKLIQASLFAIARAKAIEKSLFGTSTDEVVELAMLLSVFTNLFDEIMDEAPQILTGGDVAFMQESMLTQSWSEGKLPIIPKDPDRNPYVALLLDVMVSIMTMVTSQRVWKTDRIVKDQFLKASAAAFKAEKASTNYRDLSVIPSDTIQAEEELQLKSVHWAWAVSLAPACVHGWPVALSEDDFQTFTKSLGIFGGWVDDLSDIDSDYYTNKWSNVFLKMFNLLSFLPSGKTDFPAIIRNCMADEGVVRHLIQIGIDYHLDVLRKTEVVASDPTPIKTIISDTVLLYLSEPDYSFDALISFDGYVA